MNHFTENEFHWPVRVYFEDTDAGGVVYHASYLKFFERGRTEFLRFLGWNQQRLMTEGICAFVVSELSVKYKRPAKLDDELDIRTRVLNLKRASFVFDQRAYKQDQLMAQAEVKVVCIDPQTGSPRVLPDTMLEKIKTVASSD